MQFKKATKEQAKLRLALFGPSGSGKTFTALRLAAGMGGKVAVIDTERGSASKYADRFEFDVLELGNGDRTTEGYISAIKAAQQAEYDILIIDSVSHAWKELLAEIDRLASQFGGNKWAAWSKGTPKQSAFVDAILDYDGHIIATMRSKTAWDTSKDSRGRVKPVRVGLEPVQGKGIEYEFDLLGELSVDHVLHISKDRTGEFQDRTIEKPGEDMGKELAAWLASGAAPTPKKKRAKAKAKVEPAAQAAVEEPAVQAAVDELGGVVVFSSMKEAIDWGFEQGVFKVRQRAVNAYQKVKADVKPQSKAEMSKAWQEDVKRRLADAGKFPL